MSTWWLSECGKPNWGCVAASKFAHERRFPIEIFLKKPTKHRLVKRGLSFWNIADDQSSSTRTLKEFEAGIWGPWECTCHAINACVETHETFFVRPWQRYVLTPVVRKTRFLRRPVIASLPLNFDLSSFVDCERSGGVCTPNFLKVFPLWSVMFGTFEVVCCNFLGARTCE